MKQVNGGKRTFWAFRVRVKNLREKKQVMEYQKGGVFILCLGA
jgi:hypothetical protein